MSFSPFYGRYFTQTCLIIESSKINKMGSVAWITKSTLCLDYAISAGFLPFCKQLQPNFKRIFITTKCTYNRKTLFLLSITMQNLCMNMYNLSNFFELFYHFSGTNYWTVLKFYAGLPHDLAQWITPWGQ